jgi:ribosomal protein S18 acetylase RimI-like enzyme
MVDDQELARRALLNFGELIMLLGRSSAGINAEVRRLDALGARTEAAGGNPWFNGAVVPFGISPPETDDPLLPYCLWSVAAEVLCRIPDPAITTLCMGVDLSHPALAPNADADALAVETPPLDVFAAINERAYDDFGTFSALVRNLRDDRIRLHGLRAQDGAFICVALTLAVGEDVGVHFVATEAGHRRRGLARGLLCRVLAAARAEGRRTATLQAMEDGRGLYERIGFRRVATLVGHLRPSPSLLVAGVGHDGGGHSAPSALADAEERATRTASDSA